MNNNLINKLRKNSTIAESEILSESKFLKAKDVIPTPVPVINIALSGEVDGGLSSGSFVLAGPSRHFKTAFALLLASSYFAKYPDAAMVFYDSEFGTPESYFDSFNIDKTRVLHSPLTTVEQLRSDLANQLTGLDRGEKVIFFADSLGSLASTKETKDALSEKETADMTRARNIKSLFRIVTPLLTIKDVPLITINHVYQSMEFIPKTIISGGTGPLLSADNAWIIGRQQEKDGTELSGYNFVINVEKSRHVKEKSKLLVTVTFDKGIAKWSGMREIAEAGGFITQPSTRYIEWTNPETGEVKRTTPKKEKTDDDFWHDLVYSEPFKSFVKKTFSLGQIKMIDGAFDDLDDDEDLE